MSLWGKPVTRHYEHEYPRLGAKSLKALLTLQPGRSWFWLSRRGLRLDMMRLHLAGDAPSFSAKLMNGQRQNIRLESTPTAFKGRRWWLSCPYCSRRCGKLYWTQSAIACRQCLGLYYQSQSEAPQERHLRRIRKARQAVWGEDEPEINNLFRMLNSYPKPKGMHWCTFKEKRWQMLLNENQYMRGLLVVLERRYRGKR